MTLDMTSGSPIKRILSFCLPVLAGSFFQQLYNLADSFLVGRILGVEAFAAVGSTASLNFFILGFALGVCSGLAIPISQSFGARDGEAVRRRTGQLVWLGALLTLLLTAITWFWTDDILCLTNTPAEIYDDAYRYILIVFLGSGATILYNLLSSLLRALGDSRAPLYFLLVTVVLNALLDVLLMKTLGMGVAGAALATVLSQAAAGLACLVYIVRRVPALHLSRRHLHPNPREMALLAGIGIPMGLQFSITAVGSIMLQSAVNGLGASTVAAVTAGNKVHGLITAPLETFGIAMATYCGQNLGARQVLRIRQGVRSVTLAAMLYCAAALCFNIFAGSAVAAWFLDGADAALLRDVRQYLIVMGSAYPTLAVIFIFRNALQGMGYSRESMAAGLAELAARALAAFGMVGSMGFRAVCLASPLAWLFADVILLILYRVKMRRLDRFGPALPDPAPALRPRRAGVK